MQLYIILQQFEPDDAPRRLIARESVGIEDPEMLDFARLNSRQDLSQLRSVKKVVTFAALSADGIRFFEPLGELVGVMS